MKIDKNINRLSLHDSQFISETRSGNSIVLIFDCAMLGNLNELNIHEGVILGKTILTINGITNEKYKVYTNYEKREYELIDLPDKIGKYWSEVVTTEINDDVKMVELGGLCYDRDEDLPWSEWCLNYESLVVEWNSHITMTEWHNGKLPID